MGAGPKILIVDDDPTNVDILKARLKANDYHVIEAFDGEEALQEAKAERPDLILLDVMMPKLDGFDVCQRVKADQEMPFIPIILVTAKTETEDIVKGLGVGADDYLTKPMNHVELLARVKSMLRMPKAS